MNKFSWIGYNIDTHTGFIFANDSRTEKLCSDLNDLFAKLELSSFVHVKEIASVVGQIISMTASCGNLSQIMTRYLHLIVNSCRSWNSAVFVHNQGKEELYFWRDNLRTLNGVSFWPVPFVPSKALFSDASSTGCGAFIQGSSLVYHRNWSAEESQKSSTGRELFAIKSALETFGAHLAGQRVRCNTDNQNVVRIIQVGSMVKELQDIALNVLFASHRRIQRCNLASARPEFAGLLISMIVRYMMEFSSNWTNFGVHILFTDSLAVTIPNCLGSTPGFSSQVLKLLMLFHRIGLRKITGLFRLPFLSAGH